MPSRDFVSGRREAALQVETQAFQSRTSLSGLTSVLVVKEANLKPAIAEPSLCIFESFTAPDGVNRIVLKVLMAELANQADAVELLVDGARYGDLEDVQIALDEYKVSPDATDRLHRTGLALRNLSSR